ncbi:MAG: hypothetical protein FVQ81_17920 [Candidatus Glassbacteria bacterium]|nr:hypothetical protein [Candidatus Glassbacteria bacterium]
MIPLAEKLLYKLRLDSEKSVSLEDAARFVERSKSRVCQSLSVLVRRGLAEKPDRGHYRITKAGIECFKSGGRVRSGLHDGSKRRPRRGSLRERVWKAARMARKFSVTDLVEIAAQENETSAARGARRYLLALERAGYLKRLKNGPQAASNWKPVSRWALLRDTGPLHPLLMRDGKTVRDRNGQGGTGKPARPAIKGEDFPCG